MIIFFSCTSLQTHVHIWHSEPLHTINSNHPHNDPKGDHYLMHSIAYVMLSACVCLCMCLSARLIIPPGASVVVQGCILAPSNCQGQRAVLWSRLRLLVTLSYWSAALLSYRKYCMKKRGSKAMQRVSEKDFFHYSVEAKHELFHLRSSCNTQTSAQGQVKWGWESMQHIHLTQPWALDRHVKEWDHTHKYPPQGCIINLALQGEEFTYLRDPQY